uniref:Exocyst complex component 1-like n=1 Tax=Phallusia mammillata TaxID=59560 RepID=A0A6F9DD00_9ASCI|nr:exocyst complex component 1-like [Phallusia mammillata]
MAAIKHALQRDVFTPNQERLLGVVHVGKTGGKKKKSSFLCASVTTERPVEVYISRIKRQEKGETYKKQKTWQLKELKIVNGKESDKQTTDFDLQFDKNFKWSASSVAEKHTFLACLWKLCHRYLPRQSKPTFANIPQSLLEVSVSGTETSRGTSNLPGPDEDALEDYQALTDQEETDLERMITECEFAISDAEAFSNSLSRDLSVLDGQNIHSIMGSEVQVNSLMLLLDNALNEVSEIEARLDDYDLMVGAIASQMGQMKNQESFIQITNKNHSRLLEELDKLVMQLDLSKGHVKALREANLKHDSGIEACTSAAEALQQAMEVELPKGLSKLQAVSDQQKLFDTLRQMFAKRLYEHLITVFAKQGSEHPGSSLTKQTNELKLPKHFPYHRDLLPYKQLILWLKVADKTKYTQLCTVYTQNLNKLYSQEIKDFLTTAKQRFIQQANIDEDIGSAALRATSRSTLALNTAAFDSQSRRLTLSKKLSSSIKNLSGSQQNLAVKEKKKLFGSTQSLVKPKSKKLRIGHKKRGLAASRESLAASDFELSDREKFSSTFREVLSELEPTCQDEERFLTKFFHLNVESADTMMPGGSDDEEDDTEQGVASRKKYQEAQVTKDIRRMMTEIFSIVEPELSQLVAFGEELDPLNSLNMLVVIGQRVTQAQQDNDGSFLAKMLGNCLIEVKRNFDNFVRNKVDAVEDAHLGKNKKCGILPFVQDFEDFVELAESIFRDSERRTDIDKAYKSLIKSVFQAIERVAGESHKTPPEVVMFENYHHLLNCLSSLKIASLDQEKRDVKLRYNNYLDSYVTSMLGRPLEKLSNFFEGVEQVIETGVRPEEVGFQLKFSKQELRKCIKEYSGKDVKKGLESLHHKIVKHTAENENRLQRVVWQHMQEEFIRQYKRFEDLISKCYPESHISLEFTIENVLQYFSDIAYSQ